MNAFNKIVAIREKMKGMDPESDMYKAYEEVIASLRGSMDDIVVHKSAEPELCESCQ